MRIKKLSVLIEKLVHSFHIEELEYIKNSGLNVLSSTQIHYIDLIQHENGPTLSRLAEKLKVTKPTVTNHIDKLEKLGFIYKEQSANDARFQFIHLTDKGKEISNLHDQIHDIFTEKISKNLNKLELENLILLLDKSLK